MFEMETYAPVRTPMVAGYKLGKYDESPELDQTMYISMIISLIYLTASRHDIMQVVELVGIFQSSIKECHVNVVKRIFRYHQGNIYYFLWYPRGTNINLKAYTDVDWEVWMMEKAPVESIFPWKIFALMAQ